MSAWWEEPWPHVRLSELLLLPRLLLQGQREPPAPCSPLWGPVRLETLLLSAGSLTRGSFLERQGAQKSPVWAQNTSPLL